ncbi:MAG TPA: hypothetical protein VFY97_11815 [Rhodanobacteraceae bacterium]|nr:hypothetical protein [Rhodanobacteraceae bacterium]
MALDRPRDGGDQREAVAIPAADQHSALAGVLPHILATFRRDPALALTVAYLLIALAGIYYDYSFYQEGFGIPILSLEQVGDFLVAGLQQPVAIVLMVLTLPLCWLLDRLNAFFHRRYEIEREKLRRSAALRWWQALRLRYLNWQLGSHWFTRIMYLVIIFGYSWMFVGIYAAHNVGLAKRGGGMQVAVRLAGASADLAAGNVPAWTYLGAVSNYVFVYDHASRQPLILPVEAVASVRPPLAAKPATKRSPVAGKP